MVQNKECSIANHSHSKMGWIELITGCMFAGKTEEFIRRLNRHRYAKHELLIFKPLLDNRYSPTAVVSHSGNFLTAIAVENTAQMRELFFHHQAQNGNLTVVGIDEVQFFDSSVVDFIEELADRGLTVIVAGLDRDFKNDPFKNVDRLLVRAEYVDKLTAICHCCGNFATRTQRLVAGKLAPKTDPLILVAGEYHYEARCRNCYQKPQ